MADTEPAAAAASPSSTADVASSVIDEMEGASESADSAISTEPEKETGTEPIAAAPVSETPGVVQQPPTMEETLLSEFGFKEAFKPDGREHYIPRSKVLKMIASGLKRGSEKWGGEKQTIEQQANQYKADLDELYSDVRGDPWAFVEKLAGHDPRYGDIVKMRTAPQAPPQPAPVVAMPDPDVTLHDGSKTYSIDGLKKLLEWNTANVEARLMPKFDERLKPYEESAKEAKARQDAEKATTAVREKTRTMIADAQHWPGFKEHEQDILKALQADSEQAKAAGKRPTLSLDAAYRQAVLPKLQADRNKMREDLLKEINGAAAKTPTTTHGGAEFARKPGPEDTRSIASRIIEQAGG